MTIWKISTRDDVIEMCCLEMSEKNEELMKKGTKRGLLVEAGALNIILSDPNFRKFFIKIAKSCEAVICCRVSPS